MKQTLIISIALIIFMACSKNNNPLPNPQTTLKDTAIVKDSIVGIWSGKFGTDRKNPTQGYKWCFEIKANDSIIVYNLDSLPNPTNRFIKTGKWSIIENRVIAYWKYITAGIQGEYNFVALVSNQQKNIDGNYFLDNDPTNQFPFFLNKLPK